MDWMSRLQKAIEYIEYHLSDDLGMLKLDILAKQADSSEFNFQKIFSIITDMTVGEYIRNRRLAVAGEELLLTNTKILDLALKYGYETAESFTKAFTRFHGTTPNSARKSNAGLKSFHKFNITVNIEGGTSLEYSVAKHDSFSVLARTKVFKPASIDENKRAIPDFLEKCGEEGMYEFLRKINDNTMFFKDSILGVHDAVGCIPDGSEFRFSVGVEYLGDVSPEGYEVVVIPAQKWLIFQCTGRRPTAIQDLWYRIYTQFLPFTSYQVRVLGTVEVCREGFRNADDVVSELWLPLVNDCNQ